MGRHYHLVMQFDAYCGLSPEELRERALLLYPSSKADLDEWPQAKWDRLQERLFDVSEFMQNLHSGFDRVPESGVLPRRGS